MRFRGMMHDVASMHQFHRLLTTLSKLVKTTADVFVLRLTAEFVDLVKSESACHGGVTVWARLRAAVAFDDYNFDGLSPSDNEIQLEIVPATLARAFKSALAGSASHSTSASATGVSARSMANSFLAKSLKIKLTKKVPQGPCLVIEVEMPSSTSSSMSSTSARSRVLTHEIPVHVVAKKNWVTEEDRRSPDYDVDVWLPPLKTLKNVVDKMKNFSNHVILLAEKQLHPPRSASLKVNVDNEFVSVTTTFNDLQRLDNDAAAAEDAAATAGDAVAVRVDARKLASFFTALQIPADGVLASFKDNEALHLRIADEDFNFQYRVPAVAM